MQWVAEGTKPIMVVGSVGVDMHGIPDASR
jgi:hypothetical protein